MMITQSKGNNFCGEKKGSDPGYQVGCKRGW